MPVSRRCKHSTVYIIRKVLVKRVWEIRIIRMIIITVFLNCQKQMKCTHSGIYEYQRCLMISIFISKIIRYKWVMQIMHGKALYGHFILLEALRLWIMFLLKVTCIKPGTQYTGMIPTTIDALCGGWRGLCMAVRGGCVGNLCAPPCYCLGSTNPPLILQTVVHYPPLLRWAVL